MGGYAYKIGLKNALRDAKGAGVAEINKLQLRSQDALKTASIWSRALS